MLSNSYRTKELSKTSFIFGDENERFKNDSPTLTHSRNGTLKFQIVATVFITE